MKKWMSLILAAASLLALTACGRGGTPTTDPASTQNLMYQNGELDILDLESLDPSVVDSTYKTTYADNLVSAARVRRWLR